MRCVSFQLHIEQSRAMPSQSLHRIPLRTQVADQLRKDLLTKRRPGDRLPTEAQLVAQFGVSLVTIKEALSILSHEGFIERQQGRGTFVREVLPSAAASAAGASSAAAFAMVGLACGLNAQRFSSSTYFMPLLNRIGECLKSRQLGSRLYVGLDDEGSQGTGSSFFADVSSGLVNGVIGVGLLPDSRVFTAVSAAGLPLVVNELGHETNSAVGLLQLRRDGLDQLLRRGRRRIGCLSMEGSLPADGSMVQLLQAYPASRSVADVDAALAGLFAREPRLDAVMILDDFSLPGVLVALARKGLHTPEDVLLCVQHNQGAPEPQVPCVLMEVDLDRLARLLCDQFHARMSGAALGERISQSGRTRAAGGLAALDV